MTCSLHSFERHQASQPTIVQAAAKEVTASESKVDVLVNNAAITEPLTIPNHEV